MPRDYTKVPGYESMTQPQARYNYLHDLLDAYMRLTPEDRTRMVPCKVREERGDCRYCSFSGFLGGDPEVCCAWRAEAQPDKAIEILEMLLKNVEKNWTRTRDTSSATAPAWHETAAMIAEHYGREAQMGVAQEECAELIQAISKVRRKGATDDSRGHLAEEIADVLIMCAQLTKLFNLDLAVARKIDQKLKRQLKRIAEGDTAYETTGE